jgi:predicted GNAT superfamily acetyltransferase
VTAVSAPGSGRGFVYRRLQKPEEFRAAEELQGLGPGGSDEPIVPVPVMRAVQDNGGLVLGAFTDIYLAGVSVGFLGFDGTVLYHYVHRFVVRPEYQNHGVGFGLALFVREEVRKQGLEWIRGTIDPLSSRGAFLAIHRLGATADRYLVHYFGQQGGAGAPDRESDRIRWSWAIADPTVEERISRPRTPRRPEDPRFRDAPSLLETETSETGLQVPSSVTEPADPVVRLEVPFDVDLLRQHEAEGARRWRHAVRDAFRASFDLGYRVVEFDVLRSDHGRRSVYLLTSKPDPPAP